MKLPWGCLLVAASTLLHHSDAAAIKAQRADVEIVSSDTSMNHAYFPFGYPFPSLIGLEGIPWFDCEYNCATGDPRAPKCKCTFKPPLTCCRAYGCNTCSIPLHKQPADPKDPNQPDRPGGPRPSPTPTVGAAPDSSDPDNCKACEEYAHGCSLRSRLYCPRMMCEGGDKDVPKQCWLGGKCQKVGKDALTYWCQSPVNFPNKRDTLDDAPAEENNDALPGIDDDIPLNPNMGIIGPVIIIPPKASATPTPIPAPAPSPTQSAECKKCNDELEKCTAKALCDYKQPGQDYCVDGCRRYVCNFARPKCRDTCFDNECMRLNAVWKGSEYNGF